MPRFQLLIRELGKAPRVVPLTQPLVVGRSRRADVVIDDEEVSREQFRVEPSGALVVLEGLGKTNRTTVDGTVVEAGQRVTLNAGASIKIGRTVVMVQAGDATESAPSRPGNFDATMIAPGPAKGGPGLPPPAAEQEQTGGFAGPQGARTTAGGPPPQQATRPPAGSRSATPPGASWQRRGQPWCRGSRRAAHAHRARRRRASRRERPPARSRCVPA